MLDILNTIIRHITYLLLSHQSDQNSLFVEGPRKVAF